MGAKVHFLGYDDPGPRGGKLYAFHCPGCGYDHAFETDVTLPHEGGWTFNGAFDKPSFTPSLLCNKDYPALRCHSYVTDGRIQFLVDCHHALAGTTVELPDWEGQ